MKNYVKPEMQVEEFAANEVVAACGKQDGKYIFTCDAPKGTVYYYDASRNKKKLGGYKPCSEKHTTDGTSDYFDGFVDRNDNKKEDFGEKALIWIEWNKYPYPNYHASASLTREQINVERS